MGNRDERLGKLVWKERWLWGGVGNKNAGTSRRDSEKVQTFNDNRRERQRHQR